MHTSESILLIMALIELENARFYLSNSHRASFAHSGKAVSAVSRCNYIMVANNTG